MEKPTLTRRRVLLTLATAPLLPLVQSKGAVAATTDTLPTSAADSSVGPLLYRRSTVGVDGAWWVGNRPTSDFWSGRSSMNQSVAGIDLVALLTLAGCGRGTQGPPTPERGEFSRGMTSTRAIGAPVFETSPPRVGTLLMPTGRASVRLCWRPVTVWSSTCGSLCPTKGKCYLWLLGLDRVGFFN